MTSLVPWAATMATIIITIFLYPIAVKIRRRNKTCRPDGLEVLSDPENPTLEIVAVHGLGAHPEHTWRAKSSDMTKDTKSVHLLKNLLAPDFNRARILSFSYNSDWLMDAPVKTAQQIGQILLSQLRERHSKLCLPIIFIGHSFGGIVIKEALLEAEREAKDILSDTCGIIFLGTPHQGSSLSIFGAALAYLTEIFGSHTGLLLSLQYHNSQLNDLETRFQSCIQRLNSNTQKKMEIISFYETKPTYLLGKISMGLIVDQASARGFAIKPIPIDTDHSGLNKCSSSNDQLYTCLKDAIVRLQRPSPIEEADMWIRHFYASEDRLTIERLSGDSLPMDQCYINLAIVNQEGDRAKDGNVRLSEMLLFDRLKVKTPDKKIQVDLPTLFNNRPGKNQPRRILIRGRAGVGKTTLCKKIVYDFINHRTWADLFDRLLWVPLRRLKRRREVLGDDYNDERLLYDEYFPRHPEGNRYDPSEGRRLAGVLSRALALDSSKTLFVLDGLDEVIKDLDPESNTFSVLQRLLNRPNVIITSRPGGKLPVNLHTLDLELETIGFYPDQVSEYLEKTIRDSCQVHEIKSFLRGHRLLEGLVRIPIQLDALCFTWEDLTSIKETQTMSDIYRAIEQKLWRKDILRSERRLNGEPVTISDIPTLFSHEVEAIMNDEIRFLEFLAFTGIYNDVIEFERRHLDVLSGYLKPSLLSKTLPVLSFLRNSGSNSTYNSQSYHFLHLTFQEYFAARYFVRQWEAQEQLDCLSFSNGKIQKTEPTRFLAEHKYTAYYDIFWRFVSGLLNSTESRTRFSCGARKGTTGLVGSCTSTFPHALLERNGGFR